MWYAERIQRNALRVEHAKDIVVGNDEQLSRRPECRVFVGQQPGIDVAVRGDNWQWRDALIELTRNAPLPRFGIEETIFR
jgi:hypothetical protein